MKLTTPRVLGSLAVAVMVACAIFIGNLAYLPYSDPSYANRALAPYTMEDPTRFDETQFRADFLEGVQEAAMLTGGPADTEVIFHDSFTSGDALASVFPGHNPAVHSRIEVYLPVVRESYDLGINTDARAIAFHEYAHVLQNNYTYDQAIHTVGPVVYALSWNHELTTTRNMFDEYYQTSDGLGEEINADCVSWTLDNDNWTGYLSEEEAAEVCSLPESQEAVSILIRS